MLPEAAIRPRITTIVESIAQQIATCPPREQAGILLMTNQMLALAGRTWGAPVIDDPQTANTEHRDAALEALLESRDSLTSLAHWKGMTPSVVRQMLATDLCILTIGYLIVPNALKPMSAAWKTLWASRNHLGEAVVSIRDWEMSNGVEAVPRNAQGLPPSDEELIKTSTRFPAFFQRLRRSS